MIAPHINPSGPINRLFQQMDIADRLMESFHATEILLIPHHRHQTAISLTLKTRTVTECDLLPPLPPRPAL